MRASIAVAALLGMVFSASCAAAADSGAPRPHHRHHVHRAIAPAPRAETRSPAAEERSRRAVEPSTRNHPDADGDQDGLSTNPDNCNTGCVGGNPD